MGWLKRDYLIADVHTSPTDEAGAMVGWVKHVGTGPINLGVMVLPLEGKSIAFVSPMMSYYEHLTTNFRRLTDEEWALIYNVAPSLRPDFVNAWLADVKGNRRPGGVMLLTGVEQRKKRWTAVFAAAIAKLSQSVQRLHADPHLDSRGNKGACSAPDRL